MAVPSYQTALELARAWFVGVIDELVANHGGRTIHRKNDPGTSSEVRTYAQRPRNLENENRARWLRIVLS